MRTGTVEIQNEAPSGKCCCPPTQPHRHQVDLRATRFLDNETLPSPPFNPCSSRFRFPLRRYASGPSAWRGPYMLLPSGAIAIETLVCFPLTTQTMAISKQPTLLLLSPNISFLAYFPEDSLPVEWPTFLLIPLPPSSPHTWYSSLICCLLACAPPRKGPPCARKRRPVFSALSSYFSSGSVRPNPPQYSRSHW